jgi:hypothetical protein
MHGVVIGAWNRRVPDAFPSRMAGAHTCMGEEVMALTASGLAALVPAGLSALIPAKMAVMPVVAGLAVGTAAGASFMTGPSPDAAATVSKPAAVTATVVSPSMSAASAGRPCEAQTWPYIDAKCLTGVPQEKRAVRIVSTPRGDDAAAGAGLVSRDTVLRQPQNLNAIPSGEAALASRQKRKDARRPPAERRWDAQSYQVPSESRGHRNSGPVIVVRPLRLDSFR